LQQVEKMLVENQNLLTKKVWSWFIETKDEKEIIGLVGLWYLMKSSPISLCLLPEATKRLCRSRNQNIEYCFNELGYQYLLASCDKPNLESRKVAERIGMREVEEKA